MHAIRNRIQNICTGSLGLVLAAVGLLIKIEGVLTSLQKLICIISTIVAFAVLRFVFLEDLNKGFRGQQRVAARIEKALGLYTPGFFDDETATVYPEKWMKAGAENGDGKFFASTYLLLYTGVAFLLVAILMNGSCLDPYFVYYW